MLLRLPSLLQQGLQLQRPAEQLGRTVTVADRYSGSSVSLRPIHPSDPKLVEAELALLNPPITPPQGFITLFSHLPQC